MGSFQKAARQKSKLRLAIEGPSGSGKTYSALLIARGIGGKIAVIDTENKSASLYANLYDFDVAPLDPPFTPERYISLIEEASKIYDVLIIDSITHEWKGPGGCLEIHSSMPGNSFTNWAKITPRHDKFVSSLIYAPCHIIATMRSDEAYVLQENDKGKQEPKKVGMQADQRKGIGYEFTTVLTMDISHQCNGTKDRTGLFPIADWFIPSADTGKKLLSWLESGETMPVYVPQSTIVNIYQEYKTLLGNDKHAANAMQKAVGSKKASTQYIQEDVDKLVADLERRKREAAEKEKSNGEEIAESKGIGPDEPQSKPQGLPFDSDVNGGIN